MVLDVTGIVVDLTTCSGGERGRVHFRIGGGINIVLEGPNILELERGSTGVFGGFLQVTKGRLLRKEYMACGRHALLVHWVWEAVDNRTRPGWLKPWRRACAGAAGWFRPGGPSSLKAGKGTGRWPERKMRRPPHNVRWRNTSSNLENKLPI